VSNSLPARLTNLTFDAADLQRSDLSLHLDIVSGLNDGLEVRGTDTVVPSAAGRVFRDRKRDVRHIVLAGWIQGTGSTEANRQASYQNICDELEALFALDADPATIIGEARDGTWRSIDARTMNIVWDDEPVFGVSHVSVLLDSVEPDWQVTGGGS
jgi:hypothetical protein